MQMPLTLNPSPHRMGRGKWFWCAVYPGWRTPSRRRMQNLEDGVLTLGYNHVIPSGIWDVLSEDVYFVGRLL